MNYKLEIAKHMAPLIEGMEEAEILEGIEYPKNKEMGDFAYPCFRLAKTFRKAPQIIASELAEQLKGLEFLESVEAISGFLNFRISAAHFAKTTLEAVIADGADYGKQALGTEKPVIIEYSSANIAKPFHMGHIRSTMIGESLKRIYDFLGYKTVAINHLGDYGTQFGKLIVAYKRWGDDEALKATPIRELLRIYVKFHAEAETEPALEDEARQWFVKLEGGDEEATRLWTLFKEMSLKAFGKTYDMLGVSFDSYAGESFYTDKMPEILTLLREKGLLKKSEGAEIVDLEPYGMPPALVTKSDGSTLYLTRDLAAAKYRKDTYDFAKNIYVVGAAQRLHFQQWFKVIELMGYPWYADLVHVDFGMVSLESGALSTRKGNVTFLDDVLEKAVEQTKSIIEEKNPNLNNKEVVAKAVGVGAVVFQELYTSRTKDYTFIMEKTLSFEGETGPYVQYTHARACSVLRKTDFTANDATGVDFALLSDEASRDVVRTLSKFSEAVVTAHENYEPHTVARYVVDLAQKFNRFYHDNAIIVEDEALKKARLALVYAVKTVLASGLNLVCLEAPEQM